MTSAIASASETIKQLVNFCSISCVNFDAFGEVLLLLVGELKPVLGKKRLDEICLERFQQYSRTFIQSWIVQGKVFVNGKRVNKAGTPVSDEAVVEIMAEVPKYVCRGGHKLEAAIEQLSVDVAGKVALDSGLSTGGFTDCLLQYGASFVYGIDVGYGQVMPAVVNVMKEEATLVTLVKPQFEARRSQVGRGGIVRDPLVHQEVREKIINGVENYGFRCKGWIESPLKGADGNIEFLVRFNRTTDKFENEQSTPKPDTQ
ncbi:bacterial hemolysin-like protein [Actinidia rufa]|uniref:Bacterial hemolysin-like protein n=1 Tax=Actinidia rufa TaxID=165716 RepID=A0A7J0FL65_9ERIC|nr:bacterial hemolysin-like protein [Actinidia rufa]